MPRWLVFAVFLGHCIFALKFSSVTDHVRLGDARGKVVGFVDFNADKATDVLFQTGRSAVNSGRPILLLTLALHSTDSEISVYLWSREKQRFHLHHLLTLYVQSVHIICTTS